MQRNFKYTLLAHVKLVKQDEVTRLSFGITKRTLQFAILHFVVFTRPQCHNYRQKRRLPEQ